MPSDAKKKRTLQKRLNRNQKDMPKKKTAQKDEEIEEVANGINGHSENGIDSKVLEQDAACAHPAANGHAGDNDDDEPTGNYLGSEEDNITKNMNDLYVAAKHRSCTGVLASHPDSRDVHLHSLSINFHGAELLVDCKVELNTGRRYGLVGLNGCGKSSLLSCLGNRELPIPDHIDIFHLTNEISASDSTALECVMEVDEERIRLETEAEELAVRDTDEAQERLMDVYERLEEMDAATAETRACEILHGLGFTAEMQNTKTKHFSGGWRMRIALARALFIKPALMLLDEPTNHLDLNACVWLEQELSTYKRILVVVSHSQDFMNNVCTNIIHMNRQRLKYYGGNYDSYVQTRLEHEENQMKKHKWEQGQLDHFKTVTFYFPDCGTIPPPVVMVQKVSFRYGADKPYIYKDLEFGFDLDTRIALVGPNGAGKSTLLKLVCGELIPTDGLVRRHSHLRIGRYHQHLTEQLDLSKSAVDWMMQSYPEIKERDEMRKIIGKYGLTGQQQICPIRNLSDGQRCRIIFAWLAWRAPHMLLLDEPTNHLDMETIDALAEAINEFEGGMLLVSHDFRLISQVAEEIWICENQTVRKWEGDIFEYKEHLVSEMSRARDKRAKKGRK